MPYQALWKSKHRRKFWVAEFNKSESGTSLTTQNRSNVHFINARYQNKMQIARHIYMFSEAKKRQVSTKYDGGDKWAKQTHADTFWAINVSMTICTTSIAWLFLYGDINETCQSVVVIVSGRDFKKKKWKFSFTLVKLSITGSIFCIPENLTFLLSGWTAFFASLPSVLQLLL